MSLNLALAQKENTS